MIRKPSADRGAGAGHDVEHASRQARIHQDLTQQQRRARGQLARLSDDGAARGENEGNALTKDEEREVPGRNDRDDSDRLAGYETEHVLAQIVEGISAKGARLPSRIVEDPGGAVDLPARLDNRLPGFEGLDQRNLVAPFADQRGGPDEYSSALGAGQPRPSSVVKSPPGRGDGAIRIGGTPPRSLRDGRVMRRGESREAVAALGLPPLAVNKHAEAARRRRQSDMCADICGHGRGFLSVD